MFLTEHLDDVPVVPTAIDEIGPETIEIGRETEIEIVAETVTEEIAGEDETGPEVLLDELPPRAVTVHLDDIHQDVMVEMTEIEIEHDLRDGAMIQEYGPDHRDVMYENVIGEAHLPGELLHLHVAAITDVDHLVWTDVMIAIMSLRTGARHLHVNLQSRRLSHLEIRLGVRLLARLLFAAMIVRFLSHQFRLDPCRDPLTMRPKTEAPRELRLHRTQHLPL